ncbi:GntR family transcriptional regulator [Priestia aryabhattai]|uniref:GntR family transcriptional regulator n=1 Tax=Priestia aryabhattai TaxID=412384 RepID=UPI0018749BBA|nr:GntR family transcriptional regulator [Priestia aryabhattai]MBE5097816.1 GntR family transcriptional regulator [Priestia aryabhattai]
MVFSVATDSIHTQVTNALRKAIVSGELEMGQKISEKTLSQRLNVSRTPVREALKQLEREGLVEIIPRVGTCVRKPTEKEVTELFTIKEVLEGLAASEMTKRGPIPELENLMQAMEKMEQSVEEKNIDGYVEANTLFHESILKGCGNSKLLYHYDLLINQLPYRQFVYLTLEQPDRLEKSVQEHKRIVEAIKSQNSKLAEQLMREHVEKSGAKLKEIITDKLLQS